MYIRVCNKKGDVTDEETQKKEVMCLFSGIGSEIGRCKIFDDITSDANVLNKHMNIKVESFYAACRSGHSKFLKKICVKLGINHIERLNFAVKTLPSPLWLAAHYGNVEMIDIILEFSETIEDKPAPDGTTAFAIALGHGYYNIVEMILTTEKIQPKRDMIILCKKLMNYLYMNSDCDEEKTENARLVHKFKTIFKLEQLKTNVASEDYNHRSDQFVFYVLNSDILNKIHRKIKFAVQAMFITTIIYQITFNRLELLQY